MILDHNRFLLYKFGETKSGKKEGGTKFNLISDGVYNYTVGRNKTDLHNTRRFLGLLKQGITIRKTKIHSLKKIILNLQYLQLHTNAFLSVDS